MYDLSLHTCLCGSVTVAISASRQFGSDSTPAKM